MAGPRLGTANSYRSDSQIFQRYLLEYPAYRHANAEDTFYWERVKFGLKPTLRIVDLATVRRSPGDPVLYAVAEKQLYSSHYFETALDLSFCVRAGEKTGEPSFYLIKVWVLSRRTGLKGSVIRKAALSSSLSNLQKGLTAIKSTLERQFDSTAQKCVSRIRR